MLAPSLKSDTCLQLRIALEEARQEGLAADEKLRQQEEASRAQLQALQGALTDAQVGPYTQEATSLHVMPLGKPPGNSVALRAAFPA